MEADLKKHLTLVALGLCASQGAFATCYSVYAGERLAYQSIVAPVDLSKPLHETLPARFGPHAALVFSAADVACMGGAPALADQPTQPARPVSLGQVLGGRVLPKPKAGSAQD